MTLIKSISGIRGTIGGNIGENLTPVDIVKFTTGFAKYISEITNTDTLKIVVGRDARTSGEMVNSIVVGTLRGMGINVIDTGLSTTPTVEMAVVEHKADGGIILTASHNPAQWNALKLLNSKGEFIDSEGGKRVLELAEANALAYAEADKLGSYQVDEKSIEKHIEKVLQLKLVDTKAIEEADFTVVIDAVNSTGGIAIPKLLRALGVKKVIELYCTPNGLFPHNPEPLPEHLTDLSKAVIENKADVGFVVDPDVDRLAIVCEDGNMFGEEYTLVAVADYVIKNTPGNTVSNMSSTQALRDITEKAGLIYNSAAVGEVNVVEVMKNTKAIIGGEGNGGIIYPELHYGRDAFVGIALFLTHLALQKMKVSQLKEAYPSYTISKNKIQLSAEMNADLILEKMEEKYKNFPYSTVDGLKIEIDKEWVHLRKSNTEPIIRVYAESASPEKADALAQKIEQEIMSIS